MLKNPRNKYNRPIESVNFGHMLASFFLHEKVLRSTRCTVKCTRRRKLAQETNLLYEVTVHIFMINFYETFTAYTRYCQCQYILLTGSNFGVKCTMWVVQPFRFSNVYNE